MARTARSVHARKKRRKVLEQAKGYRGTKHTSYKRAKEQVWKSGVYAYEGRKQRKRDFRALWIQRINAGAREHGLSYSKLIHGLKLAEIDLDRKILADLAVTEPEIFGAIVAQAKNALDGKPVERRVEVERSTEPESPSPSAGRTPQAPAEQVEETEEVETSEEEIEATDAASARPRSWTWTSPAWRVRARMGASPSGTSRRPPRETSRQGMPGTPAISPKRAAKLKTKKHREAERLFLAEGGALLEEAPTAPVQVFDSEEQVRRVSTLKTPTGPVGVFPFLDVTVTELLATVRRVVLLHGVQDPGNVGTAVRSAHAFGAGVALSRGSADLYNPKTVRATMGSIFHAPVVRGGGVRRRSWPRRARPASAWSRPCPRRGRRRSLCPRGRLVVCIGAEGSGLPEEVVKSVRDGGRHTFAGALVERGCGGFDLALRGVFACATIIAHYDGERAHRAAEDPRPSPPSPPVIPRPTWKTCGCDISGARRSLRRSRRA